MEKGQRKKIFLRWLKIIVFLYSLIGILFFYLQEKILFHPAAFPKDYVYPFMDKYCKELNIPYDRETRLNIIQFKPKTDSSKGVVLYFHGNRKNIGWYQKYAANFTSKGYEVWMMDYPGFGKSTGIFSEEKLYDYALQLYKLARASHPPSGIVIYGKSLGTCFATELASIRDCKYLILETPCYSMVSLVSQYMPLYPVSRMLHYHFPNNEYIEKVTAPILIFQGTNDWLVPYGNASRLKPLLHKGDEFVTIEGGSHNDLTGFPLYHQKLDSLLSR